MLDLLKDADSRTPYMDFRGVATWARILNIHDGDTITVSMYAYGGIHKHRIRLAGINAPERTIQNPQGLIARDYLTEVLTGGRFVCTGLTAKDIINYFDSAFTVIWLSCAGLDKYGRILGNISKDINSASINALLVVGGYATIYN